MSDIEKKSRTGQGPAAPKIVVMGPSGCGKSTLARALAGKLGCQFIEGDDFHSPDNIAKMGRGEALTDADRAPFLDCVGSALAEARDGAVASCSALRRAYRDRLRSAAGDLLFVLPLVPRGELVRRVEERRDSFVPPSLVDSQLAALEPPGDDEWATLIDGTQPLPGKLRHILECIEAARS